MGIGIQNEEKLSANRPKKITSTTGNPAEIWHAVHFPAKNAWTRSLNAELDNVDAKGKINWPRPAELNLIPKKSKLIPMTVTFNYKHNRDGSIEDRKSFPSLRGNQMLIKCPLRYR